MTDLPSETQVVVIGGGVVGASVLYHLTKAGWTDVVLLERTELTAGSTWHSAGGMHTLNGDPNVAKLQQYTIELYKEIEEVSGQDCGITITGGIMLADNEQRMDWLRSAHARGRYLGMETELLSVAEAKKLLPIFDEQYFVGAMYDAHEGHVDPSGVTHAFAKAARDNGAQIHRDTWVRALDRDSSGKWRVHTIRTSTGEDLGSISCQHVVNAGGLWAREVGRMVGIELPVLAMEHTYILTEDLPEVAAYNKATGHQFLHSIDFGGEIYMRQEGGGLLLGTYEHDGRPWSPQETPWDFGMQLLPPDLEHISENLDVGFAHFPIFADAGLRQVVNGPFTFSPDGNPLLGPVRGLPGYWCACAVMAGLSQGGGVGLALANWMTDDDPGFDIWGMDVSRYGDFATSAYTRAKVNENYGRRFRITYPNEFLPIGRPLQTTAVHDRWSEFNAVWGDSYGLEVPQWFQHPGLDPIEELTWHRSNAWDRVAQESDLVRNSVGVTETSGFSKFRFSGPGARDFLSWMLAGRIPRHGRLSLTPMVNSKGGLIGDLTVGCLPPSHGEPEGPAGTVVGGATSNVDELEQFFVFGSGAAERYYERHFDRMLAEWKGEPARYRTCGYELAGLSIAGPNSRELLKRCVSVDVSNEAFRFMAFRRMEVGFAPTIAGRLTFTGDLGYEFWVPASYQRYLLDLLLEEGRDFGIQPFGAAALDSLRLEKGFGSWAREYRPIYDPYEAGLDRFIDSTSDFVGADALSEAKGRAHTKTLRCWTIDLPQDKTAADVLGDEPIWHAGTVVGWVTSGGYAHHSGLSVALGYVPAELGSISEGWQIEILGVLRDATLLTEPLLDPSGTRMRS